MTMPTTRAAPVNRMPASRISRSARAGRKAMMTAPAAGRNTANVIALFSHPLMPAPPRSLRSSHGDEDHGERPDAEEQQPGVELDLARLDQPEESPDRPGALARPVD